MIDAKTRKKIIALWRQGESKSSIQKKTKVSQPTIKKIIDTFELGEGSSVRQINKQTTPEIPETSAPFTFTEIENNNSVIYHQFILNFTKVLPQLRVKGNTLQVLAQGISPANYRAHLSQVFDPQSVAAIDAQLQSYDLPGHVFEVKISQGLYGIHSVEIKRLTTKETQFGYKLPGEEPFDFG